MATKKVSKCISYWYNNTVDVSLDPASSKPFIHIKKRGLKGEKSISLSTDAFKALVNKQEQILEAAEDVEMTARCDSEVDHSSRFHTYKRPDTIFRPSSPPGPPPPLRSESDTIFTNDERLHVRPRCRPYTTPYPGVGSNNDDFAKRHHHHDDHPLRRPQPLHSYHTAGYNDGTGYNDGADYRTSGYNSSGINGSGYASGYTPMINNQPPLLKPELQAQYLPQPHPQAMPQPQPHPQPQPQPKPQPQPHPQQSSPNDPEMV